MKILLLILVFALPIFAQDSNVHVAGVLQATANLGFGNPIYGAQVGGDYRINKVVLSGDFSVLRLKKNAGGSGQQFTAKESVRVYLNKKFFVQGTTRQWKYDVEQFGKSGVDIGGGGGVFFLGENMAGTFAANYLHNVHETQRPSGVDSKQKTVDAELRLYLQHHVFFAPRVAVSRFKSGNSTLTGVSVAVQVGFWFGGKK